MLIWPLVAVTGSQPIPRGTANVSLTNALIDTKLRTDKSDLLIALGAGAVGVALIVGLVVGPWYGWLSHTSISKHHPSVTSIAALITAVFALLRQIFQRVRVERRPQQPAGAQQPVSEQQSGAEQQSEDAQQSEDEHQHVGEDQPASEQQVAGLS
jgi:hypothetical protein